MASEQNITNGNRIKNFHLSNLCYTSKIHTILCFLSIIAPSNLNNPLGFSFQSDEADFSNIDYRYSNNTYINDEQNDFSQSISNYFDLQKEIFNTKKSEHAEQNSRKLNDDKYETIKSNFCSSLSYLSSSHLDSETILNDLRKNQPESCRKFEEELDNIMEKLRENFSEMKQKIPDFSNFQTIFEIYVKIINHLEKNPIMFVHDLKQNGEKQEDENFMFIFMFKMYSFLNEYDSVNLYKEAYFLFNFLENAFFKVKVSKKCYSLPSVSLGSCTQIQNECTCEYENYEYKQEAEESSSSLDDESNEYRSNKKRIKTKIYSPIPIYIRKKQKYKQKKTANINP